MLHFVLAPFVIQRVWVLASELHKPSDDGPLIARQKALDDVRQLCVRTEARLTCEKVTVRLNELSTDLTISTLQFGAQLAS